MKSAERSDWLDLERDLPTTAGSLGERVAALGLADVALEPWEDVVDPAGGDLPEFEDCAREIHALLGQLVPVLASSAPGAAVREGRGA